MNIAVIFAGGTGQRMQSKSVPKQFLEIHGKPIIIHTLEHFEKHKDIDAIIVSCLEEWIEHLIGLLKQYNITKVKAVVPGGETGQMSIYSGLIAADSYADALKKNSGLQYNIRHVVLIHDGVRPLINEKLITDCIASVQKYGSAITSVPAKETVLMVSGEDTNEIEFIANRSKTRLARAPQCFWLDEILDAEWKAVSAGNKDYIDSCSLMQAMGHKMHLIDGPMENIKVTTPDDFYTMRALLDAKENSQLYITD